MVHAGLWEMQTTRTPSPLCRLDLLPEDKAVIIASDGLWDVIGDQDVVTMVDQLIKVHALYDLYGAI